jgi:hypothetical protein
MRGRVRVVELPIIAIPEIKFSKKFDITLIQFKIFSYINLVVLL